MIVHVCVIVCGDLQYISYSLVHGCLYVVVYALLCVLPFTGSFYEYTGTYCAIHFFLYIFS